MKGILAVALAALSTFATACDSSNLTDAETVWCADPDNVGLVISAVRALDLDGTDVLNGHLAYLVENFAYDIDDRFVFWARDSWGFDYPESWAQGCRAASEASYGAVGSLTDAATLWCADSENVGLVVDAIRALDLDGADVLTFGSERIVEDMNGKAFKTSIYDELEKWARDTWGSIYHESWARGCAAAFELR